MTGMCRHTAPKSDRPGSADAPAPRAAAAPYAVAPVDEAQRQQRIERLKRLLDERIVLLDGAMGTMVQQHGLDEHGYRGERFRDHGRDLKGNNDILTLTRPDVIGGIHGRHRALEAGGVQVGHDLSTDLRSTAYHDE